MKRSLLWLLCLALSLALALTGCASTQDNSETEDPDTAQMSDPGEDVDPSTLTADELPTIRVAATPYSGQVLHFLAEECGLYEEAGVNVEIVFINGSTEAMEALIAGHIDVLSTYGTSGPMLLASTGVDVTIYAGYMLTGCMPVLAKEGTVFNGPEDFVGKTIITRGGGGGGSFPIQYSMVEAGYSIDDAEFLHNIDQTVAMEMVAKGEADFCAGTTGIQTQAKAYGLEPVCFLSDLLPEYSCCRVASLTDWLEENHEAVVRMLSAWLRAQEILEQDKELAIEVTVANTELSQEYVENFETDPHWQVILDPHYKAVERAWSFINDMGLLEGDTSMERLDECFDCFIYKEALDRNTAAYPESKEFYDYYQSYYEENNADFIAKQ